MIYNRIVELVSASVTIIEGAITMNDQPQVKLTRGTKELIKEAIQQIQTEDERNNRYRICEEMCRIAEDRYQGNNLNYQLNRMDIPTTGKILEKIDAFFFMYNTPY